MVSNFPVHSSIPSLSQKSEFSLNKWNKNGQQLPLDYFCFGNLNCIMKTAPRWIFYHFESRIMSKRTLSSLLKFRRMRLHYSINVHRIRLFLYLEKPKAKKCDFSAIWIELQVLIIWHLTSSNVISWWSIVIILWTILAVFICR